MHPEYRNHEYGEQNIANELAELEAYEADLLSDATTRLNLTNDEEQETIADTAMPELEEEPDQPDSDFDSDDEDVTDPQYNKYYDIKPSKILSTRVAIEQEIDDIENIDPVSTTISTFKRAKKKQYSKTEINSTVGNVNDILVKPAFLALPPLQLELFRDCITAILEKKSYPAKLQELREDLQFLKEKQKSILEEQATKELLKARQKHKKAISKPRR